MAGCRDLPSSPKAEVGRRDARREGQLSGRIAKTNNRPLPVIRLVKEAATPMTSFRVQPPQGERERASDAEQAGGRASCVDARRVGGSEAEPRGPEQAGGHTADSTAAISPPSLG